MAQKWPNIAKMAQKWPKMAQKLAPAEKNSTDISAASAAFCISGSWAGEESETREMLFVRTRSLTFGARPKHSQFSMMWLVMVEFEAHCVQFWY